MIPDTVGAVLGLFGLVAPGLVFELRRERRRPQLVESAFREAERVALTSLIFSVMSLASLIPLTGVWGALPDLGEWISRPDAYVRANWRSVALFLLLELAIAVGLAVTFEWVTRGSLRGTIVTGSVWFLVLRRDVPKEASRVWLWVTTENGTQYKGPLRAYTPGEIEQREISLGGAPILRRSPIPGQEGALGPWEEITPFDAVIIPGSDIRHFEVEYLGGDGMPLSANPPKNILQSLLRKPAWSDEERPRSTSPQPALSPAGASATAPARKVRKRR